MKAYQKLLGDQASKVAFWSTTIYLVLFAYMTKNFDLISFITYVAVGVILAKLFFKKENDTTKFFILGVATALIYNLGGNTAGLISGALSLKTVGIAALEQGLVTTLVGAVMKK